MMTPVDQSNIPCNPETPLTPVHANMEKLRQEYHPQLSPQKIEQLIHQGETLITSMSTASKSLDTWQTFLASKKWTIQEAIAFFWALTNRSAYQNQLYVRGATRIGSTPEGLSGKKLEEFLRACGGATYNEQGKLSGGFAYNRISTHMHEGLLIKENLQWGLDIREAPGLPGNRRTLLFATQMDGSFYLKPEERGWPPLQTGRQIANIWECFLHILHYIKSRFRKEKAIDTQPIQIRQEHVPKKIRQLFATTVSTLNLAKKQKAQIMSEGTKYGLHKMAELLQTHLFPPLIETQVPTEIQEAIISPSEKAKQQSVDLKGNEAVLGPLDRTNVQGTSRPASQ